MVEVNEMFKESIHRIVDRIKNESYFQWPNKIRGDPSQRNQNLYCTYHKDKGHTTKQCQVLKDHLGQLVKAGYLKEFVVASGNQGIRQGTQQRGNPLPPPLGVIEVIHTTPRGTTVTKKRRVLAVMSVEDCSSKQPSVKKLKLNREPIDYNDNDLKGTIQPHDDALVVKRVLIDQGSGADMMYPDLFKGPGPKNEDLSKYDTPLVGFDSCVVILEGQISLSVNMEGKEVEEVFIVVASFSPYTEILGRPWIHVMGAIPSTLHVKVKFRTE
nr:uncharacterized protein LOC111999006 [Quercus suber]